MKEPTKALTTCLNLRCKEMFYKDPAAALAVPDGDVEEPFNGFEATAYWCQGTQTGRGPDSEPVNKRACSNAVRRCFVGLETLA